ncbi:MAG TPA: S53 family peptidase [Polyangiaceae bacterium]|nr:S53 family peptidase [Polyangiaceae bacterium]
MSDELILVLILHENDRAKIRRIADSVSAPGADVEPIDRDKLKQFVKLPDGERQAVIEWIRQNGMSHLDVRSMSGQTVFVRARKEELAKVFGPECVRWIEEDDVASAVVPPAEWTIPRKMSPYIQSVKVRHHGSRARSTMVGDAGADNPIAFESLEAEHELGSPDLAGVTPADIRKIYNFPDAWDGSGETIALLMLGGTVDERDLHAFWTAHGIKPPEVRMVHVGSRPSKTTPHNKLYMLEVAMTVQWVGAMAPGARIMVYFIDPTVIADPWVTFLLKVVGDRETAPTICCTSWITPERSYYRSHGRKVVSGLLEQAAALGVTVISAAGDWGAFDGVPRVIKDGRYVGDAPWPHGVFPAVEDRVLAVGGTMVTCLKPLTELAWSGPPPPGLARVLHFTRVASSGGFSREVQTPSWQASVRRGWYARGDSEPAVVPYGRGYPDVALMASGPPVQRRPDEPLSMQGYQAVVGGKWVDYAGGTSVAAPIWAAIIARLNQARRAKGMRRVGLVAPLLYAIRKETPAPFREISQGHTDVEMTVVNVHGKAVTHRLPGYTACPGWDPASGLGVPNVANLIEVATRSGRGQKPGS